MCQSWFCNTNLSNQLAEDLRKCVYFILYSYMCQSWICNTNLSNQLAEDLRSCVLVSYCILICVSPRFVIQILAISLPRIREVVFLFHIVFLYVSVLVL